MVPQARSEITRQKILNAAIDLFSEVPWNFSSQQSSPTRHWPTSASFSPASPYVPQATGSPDRAHQPH